MSERPVLRLWHLTVTPVATVGYPSWGLVFWRPSKDNYGLFAEIDVPWNHYECRWRGEKFWPDLLRLVTRRSE